MKEFSEPLFKYVEKLLPPYQFWAVLTVVSAILLLLPNAQLTSLGLATFVTSFKGYISLILIVSAVILFVKGINYFSHWLANRKPVDADNLNDEEKALLVFFHHNRFDGFRARRDHPAIRSLSHRGFIQDAYTMVIVSGDPFDRFEMTTAGRKKLSSEKFFTSISSAFFNEQQVLNFINSIADRQYTTHNPHQFD